MCVLQAQPDPTLPAMIPTPSGDRPLTLLEPAFGHEYWLGHKDTAILFINAPDLVVILDFNRFALRTRWVVYWVTNTSVCIQSFLLVAIQVHGG